MSHATDQILGRSLVAGMPEGPCGRQFFPVAPATGEKLEPAFETAAPAAVQRSGDLAGAACSDYGHRSGPERAGLLRNIAAGIEGLGAVLIDRAHAETALPVARLEGERARTCHQLRLFADLVEDGGWLDRRIEPASPDRKPLPKRDLRSLFRPLGPVAVFGASNFPLAFSVAGGDTAAALAAGCPVVVKAHPAHPGTSELVGRAISAAVKAAGLPGGVFSLLFDEGIDVGIALINHPQIACGAFTGSRTGGLALARVAAARPAPIPFFAEMSSVNPVFLLAGSSQAQPEILAQGLHGSITLGCGQFCTKPGIIFTLSEAADERLIEKLRACIAQTRPAVLLSAAILQAYDLNVSARASRPNVSVLARGEEPSASGKAVAVLFGTDAESFQRDPDLSEEIFGPSSLVVRCRSVEEFYSCAATLTGQLTATVWSAPSDRAEAQSLLAILERKAGRLIINDFPTGVEVGAAIVHGGPFPATTDGRFSSVGTRSIYRFVRPIAFQNFPSDLLPADLR